MTNKNYMIISVDSEKAFDKIQHPFMIKTLQKAGIEGTYLNIIKSYIWQTHSKHYPQRWKIESISPKVRKKTRVPTLTTTIQHHFVSFGHSNPRRKRNKRNPDWKRRSKALTVFRWHDTVYIENPKDSIRKLLELISKFSKVAGCKINAQKSLAFLYTNNEKSERETKEAIPFTIATKRIKYLGINLPKETKELYTESYKTMIKEINWRQLL